MIILGITGSVGTGKSFASNFFKKQRVPVFDSDHEVSLLYKKKKVLGIIMQNFPKAFKKNKLIKEELTKIVFQDKNKLLILENIIYKFLKERKYKWIRKQFRNKSKFVVFDVPLLFEKDNIKKYDKIIVMTCAEKIQMARVLKRNGWDEIRFTQTKLLQMDDKKKIKLANNIIYSDRGKRIVYNKIYNILKKSNNLRKRSANKILMDFNN